MSTILLWRDLNTRHMKLDKFVYIKPYYIKGIYTWFFKLGNLNILIYTYNRQRKINQINTW